MNEYLTTDELCGFTEEGCEDEQWSVIPGYSNYYISTKGRVWNSNSGKFLKPYSDGNDYPMVILCSNGERRTTHIHRIEALVFKDNPDNLPVVRHLDDNKLNNDINNLAWGTQTENIFDGIRNGCWDDRLRPIIAINNDTGIGYYYESCAEAAKWLGCGYTSVGAALRECKYIYIYGYRIEDAREEYLYDGIKNGDPVNHLFLTKKTKRPNKSTKVRCTRCDDGEEMIFDNIIEAVKFFDSPYKTIQSAISRKYKHKGYYVEYVD